MCAASLGGTLRIDNLAITTLPAHFSSGTVGLLECPGETPYTASAPEQPTSLSLVSLEVSSWACTGQESG